MIVGLYSPAPQSGKTTFARRLQHKHRFERVRFAAPMKQMLHALLEEMGFDHLVISEMLDGSAKEALVPGFDVTPRRLMQTIGTEWGRNCIDKDFWVNITRSKIEHLLHVGAKGVVIDDIRMENEYEMLRLLGATMVRIVRPGATVVSSHATEGRLDGARWDVTLHNTSTVWDFQQAVDHLMADLRVAA